MYWKVCGSFTLLLFLYFVPESKAWSGNVCTRLAMNWVYQQYCICRYWWGCSAWRGSWVPIYYYETYCCPGWTHNGNQACTIPICYPTCKNGGTCISPNVCACPSAYYGTTCETSNILPQRSRAADQGTAQCSYQYPCYPGDCAAPNNCTCFKGFGGTPSSTVGCRDIISDDEKPQLSRVLAILANLERIQNAPDEVKYEFVADATNKNETEIIWSNQNQFNLLSLEFEFIYMNPNGFPANRPIYVHDYGIGIVKGSIHVNLTKIPRDGGPIRDVHLDQTYICSGLSYMKPILNTAVKCYIKDDQFSRAISNGDWFTVTFQAENGGFRTRYNTDLGTLLNPDIVMGRIDRKRVEFRFDCEAAIHCSEKDRTCQEKPLAITEDITSKPIEIYWGGWKDDLAGMWQYYLEIFKLSPDPYGRLIEMDPLNPIFTQLISETAPHYANYTPIEPGMYSVLLEVRDMANNSRTARRLFLYDNVSTVEIDTTMEHKLYVSTASSISEYVWQASPDAITVVWSGHFFNRIHRENKLLNQVQFQKVYEDGILSSCKYISQGLDDEEGMRSIQEITNFNGIVRFEVNVDLTDGVNLPETGWKDVSPLAEKYAFQASLDSGRKMKVWVRAHDVMGHSAYDFTEVKFDASPPMVSKLSFQRNYPNGSYKYCSRFMFDAKDDDSGVHTLQYKLVMNGTGEVKYTGMSLANFNPDPTLCDTDAECRCMDNKCFKVNQILDIDNCWFLTKYNILKTATVTVQVFVQNQAGVSRTFSQEVSDLDKLSGLTESYLPKNIKTSNVQTNGVRLNWELPDSCYGETDIVIEIAETGTKYGVTKESNFIDVIGLEEGKEYTARFRMLYGTEDLGISVQFTFTTGRTHNSDNSALIWAIVGVLGFLLIIAILIGIIILLRRGHASQSIQQKYNEFFAIRKESRSMAATNQIYGMDNPAMSKLYLYGGMSFKHEQAWHLSKNDIMFESLIKQGHFANIYKATMHYGSKTQEHVVAKTLRVTQTDADLQLMKAKMNFLGTKVGSHPNILKFVGAVLSDDTIGPFIVHEYCENGTLKEYLERNKNNVTVELQELLYRFGLDIAKGMEFLAKKDIVHRRLAARNVLLNILNEVKITGFGPQPTGTTDDGDVEVGPSGKKERILIKWMAPECMESTAGATQKSDVWSYAVVLWEIFSLGETPYSNIRSRDLPGRLKKGERLQKPKHCDDTWYNVMKRIWSYDPMKRPTFTEIRGELDQMCVTSGDDCYYYKR